MAMELDSSIPIAAVGSARPSAPATILCCECGAPIAGSEAVDALCNDCIKLRIDIADGIQREGTLHTCKDCDRWMSPPNQWVVAALESRELLALCLRKLKGLHKTRIIDASFIWTEPHSRRVKVKISVQQEAQQGTILQQTFQVEFVVAYHQCPDCAKSYTHNTWRANVQVRQKVPHKRTFLFLEQLILRNGAHKDTINIKEEDAGIDFFFAQKNHAEKFVDFLASTVPVKMKKSQQLISMDVHTSQKSYKFNYSVELVPICKDDLVALPLKLARQIGNIYPLTLCYRIGTAVNLVDPNTLQVADVSTSAFWREPFKPLADVKQLTEFIIMDIELLGPANGRMVLAEATVRRAADFGVNDVEYTTRTHLGGLLHPGDSAMGYHIAGTNFNNEYLTAIEDNERLATQLPDVVLVKKVYPQRKKNKSRNWRLRRMAMEQSEMAPRKQDADREEMEYEMFLRDVEQDKELQQSLNLYKSQRQPKRQVEKMEGVEEETGNEGQEEDASGDENDGLDIPLDELMDEFEDMTMEDNEEVL